MDELGLVRLHDWDLRFNREVEAWRTRRFAFGEADCCLFCAAMVQAITGRDVFKPFRGYVDEDSAMAQLEEGGGLITMTRSVMDAVGAPHVKPTYAKRGDLALIEWQAATEDDDRIVAVGIVGGGGVYCLGPEGLTVERLSAVRMAWSIG